MSSTPVAWSRPGPQRLSFGRTTQIVLPALILLSIGIWFNYLYAERLTNPRSLVSLMLSWLVPQLFFLSVATTFVWAIGRMTKARIAWWDALGLWLLTGLAHVISGGYAIYNLSTFPSDTRLVDIPVVLSIYGNDGSNFFGTVINQVAVDELLHLGLFAGLVSQRLQLRAWWWLAVGMIVPYLVTVTAFEWFFQLIQ